MGGGGGGDGGARQREQDRQNRISEGNTAIDSAFSGFNDDFFGGINSNFLRFQQPEVDNQFRDAKKNLTFALSRSGNLSSSAGANETRKLIEQLNRANQLVASEADRFTQDLRGNVSNSQSNLRSLLTSTEDPVAAGNQALAEAQRLNQPPVFAPLGQLFSGVTDSLNQAFNTSQNGFRGALGARLFGGSGGGGGSTSVFR